jgi:hypothetical protein
MERFNVSSSLWHVPMCPQPKLQFKALVHPSFAVEMLAALFMVARPNACVLTVKPRTIFKLVAKRLAMRFPLQAIQDFVSKQLVNTINSKCFNLYPCIKCLFKVGMQRL